MYAQDLSAGVSLAKLLDEREFAFADDIVAHACCHDFRHCRAGDLFVALLTSRDGGEIEDGHLHVEQAVKRGATAVLTERLLPIQVPQCIVPSSKLAYAKLCQRLAGSPGKHLDSFGAIGSGGYAVTRQLTRLFDSQGESPAYFGPLGYSDGIEFLSHRGPVSANRYARWLANVVNNGCSQGIIEMTQQGLANSVFTGAPTNGLVFTGFETSTRSLHRGSVMTTQVERALSTLTPGGFITANVDCPFVDELVRDLSVPMLRVSLNPTNDADLSATIVERQASEQTAMLQVGTDTAYLRTRIIGEHYLRCCLMTIATGLQLGLQLEDIVAAIESIDSIAGYLQRVECGQPFSVFVDSAASPADLRRVLRSLRNVTEGRLICVFGEGNPLQPLETEAAVRAQRGRVGERWSDMTVVTSDEANSQAPLNSIHDVLDGFQDVARPQIVPNRTRAIEFALSKAKAGDTVLIAGPHNASVHNSTKNAVLEGTEQTNKQLLPDTEVVKYWLYNLDAYTEQQSS